MKGKTKPVQQGENLVQYDKDNLAEYREYEAAKEVLENKDKKGFRKPNRRALERAADTMKEYRRKKALAFLEEHKQRCTYYGLEIKAYMEQLPNGLAKPSLHIADFDPFAAMRNMKPWSEALEENLATRLNCTHELDEDTGSCKKCQLGKDNWGSNNDGVTDEYLAKQRERIAEQKAHEKDCENERHVLNEEAKKDPNAPMQFCVHCRKPKNAWGEPKETQDAEALAQESLGDKGE